MKFVTTFLTALFLLVSGSQAQDIKRSAIFLKNWDLAGAEKFAADGATFLLAMPIFFSKFSISVCVIVIIVSYGRSFKSCEGTENTCFVENRYLQDLSIYM